MGKKELYDASFQLLTETERAILVSDDGGETKHWLPKSQIEYETRDNGIVEVTLPLWLAREKGIV